MKFNKYSIQHSMGNVSDIALSPDNSKLASGGWDGFVILWDTQTLKEIKKFYNHENHIFSVAFSYDSQVLAAGGTNEYITIWDLINLKMEGPIKLIPCNGIIFSITFSYDRKSLIYGGVDQFVVIWEIEKDRALSIIDQSHWVNKIAYAGHYLSASLLNGEVTLCSTQKLITRWRAFKQMTLGVQFSPNKQFLIAIGDESVCKLWDVEIVQQNHQPLRIFEGFLEGCCGNGCTLFSSEFVIAYKEMDRIIRIFQEQNGELYQEIQNSFEILSMSASKHFGIIAVGGREGKINIFKSESEQNSLLIKDQLNVLYYNN